MSLQYHHQRRDENGPSRKHNRSTSEDKEIAFDRQNWPLVMGAMIHLES